MLQRTPQQIMKEVKDQLVADNATEGGGKSKWRWFWGKPPKFQDIKINNALEGLESDGDEEVMRKRA